MASHYINKEEFREELRKCQDDNKVSNKLGKMFLDIAKNLTNHRNFVRYTQEEKNDFISEGIEKCILYFRTFDCDRGSSPLAYFTQTCYNANRSILKKEYAHLNFKNKVHDENEHELIEELSEYA